MSMRWFFNFVADPVYSRGPPQDAGDDDRHG